MIYFFNCSDEFSALEEKSRKTKLLESHVLTYSNTFLHLDFKIVVYF